VLDTMNKLRILLADDHAMIRQGLRSLIDAQPDMEVVGEADNGWTAVSLASELSPQVIVLDISMPQLNGLQAMAWLRERAPHLKVLTVTRHSDESYLHGVLQAGAGGYLLKQSASEELVRAIRQVAAGRTYIDPRMTHALVHHAASERDPVAAPPDDRISAPEEQVLRLVAAGHTRLEIARHLDITVETVDAHKTHAMDKLNLKNRVDVVRYARLHGWQRAT
jgi:DNA-binding NarL/FixJ family response regulator